jgi:hypothetical protein
VGAVVRLEQAGPPIGQLALLALAVLGLHLVLLLGLPVSTGGDPQAGLAGLPTIAPETAPAEALAAQPEAPRPVERSSVRWLLAPPPAPPPARPAPPPTAPARSAPPAPVAASLPPSEPASPAAQEPIEPDVLAEEQAWDIDPIPDVAAWIPSELSAGVAAPPDERLAEAQAPPRPAPAATSAAEAPEGARTTPPTGIRDTAVPSTRTRGLPAATPPASTQLVFDVNGQARGLNYHASATLDWLHDGQSYQAQMRVSAFMVGSRTQRSTGRLDATGLHPDRFVDISRRERETRFDTERERIAYAGHAHEDPLQAGAQDRLSVVLQLAARFNAAAPVAGQRLNLQVASASGAERWEFEVVGQGAVRVPAGEFSAWHVQRVARHPGDTQTSFWLAPSLEHLPVRLVLIQPNGDQLEQSLKRLP